MSDTLEEFWSSSPIEAWRWWMIHLLEVDDRLMGAFRTWWPESVMVAECLVTRESKLSPMLYEKPLHSHVPDLECVCGIYAYKECSDLPSLKMFRVWGKVKLSGRIIEHEIGYRAERAEMVELFVSPERIWLKDNLSRFYGVPVSLMHIGCSL